MDLRELKVKPEELNRHPWELARLEVVLDLMKPLLQSENIVLDIGCGDLFFLEALNSKGVNGEFHAVDIAFTNEQMEYFNKRYEDKPFSVYQGMDVLESTIEKDASIVLLLDVIEHIENDITFLQDLVRRKCISSFTLFFITVPAYQWLFCSHDVFLGHYRRYTNKMLKEHVEESGLEVVKIGYFFFTLFLVRIFSKLMDRDEKTNSTGLVEWQGSKFVTSLTKRILILDAKVLSFFHMLGIKIPGLSNYVICRRKL